MPPVEAHTPMEMTHLGSIIWSYTWRSTGAIFWETLPATIIRSAWRGEARKTSMPRRLMSKSAAPTAIISMAQHASPKVAGHTLLRRAHRTRSSRRPVRKLCWRSSSPTSRPLRRLPGRPWLGRDATDRRLARPGRDARLEPPARSPLQRAVAHQVDEGDQDHRREHEDLHEAEHPQPPEDHGPGVEEDHLDVEDDEDHGHEVEAHREARRGLAPRDDPGLVGRHLLRRRALARREQLGRGEREPCEERSEDEKQEDREVLVHGSAVLPRARAHGHIRDGAVAGPEVPGAGAPRAVCTTSSSSGRAPPARRAPTGSPMPAGTSRSSRRSGSRGRRRAGTASR